MTERGESAPAEPQATVWLQVFRGTPEVDGLRAAREQVRVARALAEVPAIREAFAKGRLSYSQVRALTRVARSENEQELLELARHATAAQLDKLVSGYLRADVLRDRARDAYERRPRPPAAWPAITRSSRCTTARAGPWAAGAAPDSRRGG